MPSNLDRAPMKNGLPSFDFSLGPSVLPALAVDGTVRAVAHDGDRLYIAGQFSHVGVAVGGLAALDARQAASTSYPPRFSGDVRAANDPSAYVTSIVGDGARGAFVTGAFTRADGYPVPGLVHLGSDGSIDFSFSTGQIDGLVADATLGPSALYIVGNFSTINGTRRDGCAALDPKTGALLPWDGCADMSGVRTSIAAAQGKVYIGSTLEDGAGTWRGSVVGVDGRTGRVASTFDLVGPGSAPSGSHTVIRSSGSTVFFGGPFAAISGTSRSRLAAIDAASDTLSALAPTIDDTVDALAVSGSRLFIAGRFSTVSGAPRDGFAAIDLTSGNATSFAPTFDHGTPSGACQTRGCTPTIATIDDAVFVSGRFTAVGGEARPGFAAFDLSSGALRPFSPGANGPVSAVAPLGSSVLLGGEFNMIHATPRVNVAAMDLMTGALSDWNAGAWASAGGGSVDAIHVYSGAVYAAGTFDTVGTSGASTARNAIAAFDAKTAEVLRWAPATPNGRVAAFEGVGDTVYIGGSFTAVGAEARGAMAALDRTTGELLKWDPAVTFEPKDSGVTSIVADGSTVYFGGQFGAVGGAARFNFGAVDAKTGAARALAPRIGDLRRFAVVDSWILAVGSDGLSAYDTTTGSRRPMVPTATDFATDGATLYTVDTAGRLDARDLGTGLAISSWYANFAGASGAPLPGRAVGPMTLTPRGLVFLPGGEPMSLQAGKRVLPLSNVAMITPAR